MTSVKASGCLSTARWFIRAGTDCRTPARTARIWAFPTERPMSMSEQPIREPDEIRRDCARKLASVEISDMFSAILGSLLGEDWAKPRIEEMRITPDRCLLARIDGEASFKAFLGAEADLIRNIHGVAAVAELDGDEVGYLVGRVAEIKGIG